MKLVFVGLVIVCFIQEHMVKSLKCYYNECSCNSKEAYFNPTPEQCHCSHPGHGKIEKCTEQFSYCYETTVEKESKQVAFRGCRDGNKKVPPKCQPGITGDKNKLFPNGEECWCSDDLCNTKYVNKIQEK